MLYRYYYIMKVVNSLVYRISLMEFYQIEALRRDGVTDNDIVMTLRSGDITPWSKLNAHFDWRELLNLYEADVDAFDPILAGDFQIKFITFPGLERILEMKFEQIADIDYTVGESAVTGLCLSEADEGLLRQMLSANWELIEHADGTLTVQLRN